jgi:hypothetical protein
LIPKALAEVYEHGQDQHQVFLKELQPHGFREQEWDFLLQSREDSGRPREDRPAVPARRGGYPGGHADGMGADV